MSVFSSNLTIQIAFNPRFVYIPSEFLLICSILTISFCLVVAKILLCRASFMLLMHHLPLMSLYEETRPN